MVDSKGNYKFDLGVGGLSDLFGFFFLIIYIFFINYLSVSKISIDILWRKEDISWIWQNQEKGIQGLMVIARLKRYLASCQTLITPCTYFRILAALQIKFLLYFLFYFSKRYDGFTTPNFSRHIYHQYKRF